MKYIKTYEFFKMFDFDNEDDKIVKNIISNINDVEIIMDKYSSANPYEISFYYKHEMFKLEKGFFNEYTLVVNKIEINSKYNSNLFKILTKIYNEKVENERIKDLKLKNDKEIREFELLKKQKEPFIDFVVEIFNNPNYKTSFNSMNIISASLDIMSHIDDIARSWSKININLKSGEITLEYSYPRYSYHTIYNGTLNRDELDKLKFLKDDIIKKQEIEKNKKSEYVKKLKNKLKS